MAGCVEMMVFREGERSGFTGIGVFWVVDALSTIIAGLNSDSSCSRDGVLSDN